MQPLAIATYDHWTTDGLSPSQRETGPANPTGVSHVARDMNDDGNEIANHRVGLKRQDLSTQKTTQEMDHLLANASTASQSPAAPMFQAIFRVTSQTGA